MYTHSTIKLRLLKIMKFCFLIDKNTCKVLCPTPQIVPKYVGAKLGCLNICLKGLWVVTFLQRERAVSFSFLPFTNQTTYFSWSLQLITRQTISFPFLSNLLSSENLSFSSLSFNGSVTHRKTPGPWFLYLNIVQCTL